MAALQGGDEQVDSATDLQQTCNLTNESNVALNESSQDDFSEVGGINSKHKSPIAFLTNWWTGISALKYIVKVNSPGQIKTKGRRKDQNMKVGEVTKIVWLLVLKVKVLLIL